MLNSNEQFEVNDTFQLAFVHVRDGPRGGGRPRRVKPGHQSLMVLRRMKQTVVRIPRTCENTCCTRAIVTARAKVDNHPKWRAFLRGLEADRLHELAGVPRGKCGDAELKCFAAHPSMYDYTIVVVDADRCFETFEPGQRTEACPDLRPVFAFVLRGHLFREPRGTQLRWETHRTRETCRVHYASEIARTV